MQERGRRERERASAYGDSVSARRKKRDGTRGRERRDGERGRERPLPIRWRCERRMSKGCVVIVWSALFTDYTLIAFKLPHSTHRRPVGRSVGRSIDWLVGRLVGRSVCRSVVRATLSPLAYLFLVAQQRRRCRRHRFPSRYSTHVSNEATTNVRTYECTHATHARTAHTRRGLPRREKRNGEGRRERKRAHAAAPRCAAPRHETEGLYNGARRPATDRGSCTECRTAPRRAAYRPLTRFRRTAVAARPPLSPSVGDGVGTILVTPLVAPFPRGTEAAERPPRASVALDADVDVAVVVAVPAVTTITRLAVASRSTPAHGTHIRTHSQTHTTAAPFSLISPPLSSSFTSPFVHVTVLLRFPARRLLPRITSLYLALYFFHGRTKRGLSCFNGCTNYTALPRGVSTHYF